MARKVVVVNSEWVRNEDWQSLGHEIQVILGENHILSDIEQLKIIDENGIDITKWTQFSFLYSVERKKLEMDKDKDEY